MNPIVYMETSVVAYLTARPSRDLVIAARQMWTREWWDIASQAWTLRISDQMRCMSLWPPYPQPTTS
jgi:hypothetical protein